MSREVRVVYHHEAEAWWADSPDVEGFVASGSDLSEIRRLVREGLEFYLEDDEVEIYEQAPWATGVIVETHFISQGFAAPMTSNAWGRTEPRTLVDHLGSSSFEVQRREVAAAS
jgi:predicted RNase H-like HicB family nuclease